MRNILSLLSLFLLSCVSAAYGAPAVSSAIVEARSAATCADPSLAVPFVAAFLNTPGATAHAIQPRIVFVHLDSVDAEQWQIQGELFNAWDSPQQFTVPLYQLATPSFNDFTYAIPVDGVTPPTISGFVTGNIVGFVYATQECGSVPLLAAFQPTVGDHWFTTSVAEHNSLLSLGWEDAGTVGFVLPLNS